MRRRWIFLFFACVLAVGCSLTGGTESAGNGEPPKPVRHSPEATVILATAVPDPSETPAPEPEAAGLNPAPPAQPVRLIFIHHSSGENWLADWSGGLGQALMDNNYYVSDTNYGWGPAADELGVPIGDATDTGHWWNWFLGPSRDAIWDALLAESEPHADYARLAENPGGPNRIVMFKSCFPNSAISGSPTDPPAAGGNPLEGQWAGSEFQTVANDKRLYLDLLTFFESQPDTLFIAITAPPLEAGETSPEQAANARAFNRWLVEDWLSGYPLANVGVFDFYNVLTTNGGSIDENDAGADGGNHHRYSAGGIEYVTDQGGDISAYAREGDSHPSPAGNQKATAEFVPLLNILYHRWADSLGD
jgi:hypothetical protein